MSEYMKEVERLIAAHESAIRQHDRGAEWDEGPAKTLAALLAHIQRGAPEGWKEATIAWEVCASIHREYAKKKDPFFTTRQADFVRHTEAARAAMRGEECDLPPRGWRCTREKGHEGPCAAVECPWEVEIVERAMQRLRGEVKP